MNMLENWMTPRRAEITPGFFVGRVLPYRGGRGVGPFVFLDHMGPHTFTEGAASDVPPHPHIGLSTMTYLFEGEIDHRDSIGSEQRIRPGDVNWMTAGRGIVHSERAPAEFKKSPLTLHGLQAWVALPVADEEVEPRFEHRERATLPTIETNGVRHRLIAGEAFGLRSPVSCYSRLFYAHSEIPEGRTFEFDSNGQEAAFYVVSGTVVCEGQTYVGPGLLHFVPGAQISFRAKETTMGVLLGGDPFPEHRRIYWNFVSSRPERVEEAKKQWRDQAFPRIAGETEFVPLPK